MGLSSFLIRIIFLALPGIIGLKIFRTLHGSKSNSKPLDYLDILLFSLLSYICVFVIGVWGFGNELSSYEAVFNEKLPLRIDEIIFASIFSIPLAVLASYGYQYRWINIIGQKIKATKKYGDEDVWWRFHQGLPNAEWFFVRDHKNNLCYFGSIRFYSDSGIQRELTLTQVSVFVNSTSQFLYESDVVYISRDAYDLSIEVAPVEKSTITEESL